MQIKPYTGAVDKDLMALLLMADPDEHTVRQYLPGAELFVASDGGATIGVAVLSLSEAPCELKNIAVRPGYQGRGIAKQLIATVKARAKALGASALQVGTGNSSLNQLALYQKCGFRIVGVKPDFFLSYHPPIHENGIRCLDLIVLEAVL